MAEMKRRYSYRAYPDKGTQARLLRIFGCCRVVFNQFVTQRQRLSSLGLDGLVDLNTTGRQVTTLAKRTPEFAFLAEVPAGVLQQSVDDARRAYVNWARSVSGRRRGRRIGAPRLKKRSHTQKARFARNSRFKVLSTPGSRWGKVQIPGVGIIRYRKTRELPSDPSSITVTSRGDGTWMVSFVVDVAVAPTRTVAPRTAAIDVGLTDFAAIVYSDGTREKVDNPRYLKAALRRLRREQRGMQRCQPGSRNRDRRRRRLAKQHASVAFKRQDHHTKLAARLVAANATVCHETLTLAGLGRTRMARSIYDTGIGKFFRVLDGLAETQGVTVLKTGMWEPTSQVCSACGMSGGKKPLDVRIWRCNGCSAVLDRDWNAAVNIMVAAGQAETLNARGGDIRRLLATANPDEAGTHRTLRSYP